MTLLVPMKISDIVSNSSCIIDNCKQLIILDVFFNDNIPTILYGDKKIDMFTINYVIARIIFRKLEIL